MSRIAAALQSIKEDADALLVTHPTNVRYLTGFTGSNGQLLVAEQPVFFTDGRYETQSAEQVTGAEIRIYSGGGLYPVLREVLEHRAVTTLAFEAAHVTVESHKKMAEALDGVGLVPVTDRLERLRARKSPDEIDAIRRAQKITEDALTDVLDAWKGGTEVELALEIELAIRRSSDGLAFDVIAASGSQAALPHGRPRHVPVDPEDVLLIDIGARVDGYCSDMTRTWLRRAADPMPKAYAAVLRALEAGCDAIRPGVTGRDVDAAARDVLAAEGFGDRFTHSTGHGVGLDIHEAPTLSVTSESVLEAGMVVTVEPGVYLPGVGGIRIEDLLVVTDGGSENLTRLPRDTR